MGGEQTDQIIIFTTLLLALVFFVWGKWRYDIVALAALLAGGLTGVVPEESLFIGFSHPAVITVGAILIVSRGLVMSGVVDLIGQYMQRCGNQGYIQIFTLCFAVMVLSAFMNNVGALALFMPIAIQWGRKANTSPAILLMPMAFCSLLGGMMTEIGTPPNLIISSMREQILGERYGMFEFSKIGIAAGAFGLVFVTLVGWRLVPRRISKFSQDELFQIADYSTELKIPDSSRWDGKILGDLKLSNEGDINILGIIRGQLKIIAPSSLERMKAGDVLIVEGNTEALNKLAKTSDIELVGEKHFADNVLDEDEKGLFESVVLPGSIMVGRTAKSLNMRWRYGLNLVAVARKGQRLRSRISSVTFLPGDLLLFQGRPDVIGESMQILGTALIGNRGRLGSKPSDIWKALLTFITGIILVATRVLPFEIAFTLVALIFMVTKLLTLREAYTSVEWPILILLGAMIPLGQAFEDTGAAKTLADSAFRLVGENQPVIGVVLSMGITLILTNLINNAAAAVLMVPIGIELAGKFAVNPDPFLMGIAVAASSAFLTPIGHQSNTLVMGPGGYKFSDYWKLGLPMTILVFLIAVPLVLYFWPLR